ncbi:hypothetical protein DNH61_09820 [Paenibacillus sambharensis]|uniref:YitT family protein n=1 Tax=Paenibacillus sambharensis TaxID=1803190 RepID=A0A2W1L7Q4_9BACL|nr:YitT family protein [Paenibacillus sambharensis]PZD96188.1 hypothetical protein DNH61_09820 [Paenibacillus sambharensis]
MIVQKLWIMTLGGLLIALAINLFILPYHITEGGLIGVGLLLKYLLHVNAGLAMLVISIPIYAVAWWYRRRLVMYNIISALITALLIDAVHLIPYKLPLHPLASAIIGGIMIGTGVGVMLRHSITTDGIDLIAHLVSRFVRINVGIVIFFLDVLIIGAGYFIMTEKQFLLSLITITGVGFITLLLTHNHSQHSNPVAD